MTLLVIASLTISFILMGRFIFGMWFNHIGLYAAVWGGSLFLFELELLHFYPLGTMTWVIIVVAFVAFVLGTVTVTAFQFGTRRGLISVHNVETESSQGSDEQSLLVNILWLLNIISLATVLQHWYIMAQVSGGALRVILLANLLYSFRVEHGIPGGIPYLEALALTGSMLAGVHTAAKGRLKLVAVAPLMIVLVGEVVNVGRAKIIMAGILFISGYLFYRHHHKIVTATKTSGRLRRVLAVIAMLGVLFGGMEFIRSSRGANESLAGASRSLQTLRGASFITPSIVLYATVHYGVLNAYLQSEGEDTPWGANTFAPVYRILSKFGSSVQVPTYPKFYTTPTKANTATYIKELHADFGWMGVLLYPYVLGLLTTAVWVGMAKRFRYTQLAGLGFLYVVIVMNIFFSTTRAGDLLVACGCGLLVGIILDRKAMRTTGTASA